MSLMGYEEKDVATMLASVTLAKKFFEKEGYTKLSDGLKLTSDFLEGMLEEGRV